LEESEVSSWPYSVLEVGPDSFEVFKLRYKATGVPLPNENVIPVFLFNSKKTRGQVGMLLVEPLAVTVHMLPEFMTEPGQ